MRQPLGQHFLHDRHVIQTILEASSLARHETALEIGPGKGILTEALVSRVDKLVAVELDETLASRLQERFAGNPGVRIIRLDFLKVQWDSVFQPSERPIKILGNLPYAITSPIIEKILAWNGWETAVFLIQREVADRMRSPPGSKIYGILSLAVQLFAEVDSILKVKPGAFSPPPDVMSAVVRLRRKAKPDVAESLVGPFFDLVRGAFAHRRKTLGNSLALHSGAPKERLEAWLRREAMDPGRRAETVGLEEYVRLTEKWVDFRRENGFDIRRDNVYNTRRLSG